MTRYYQVGDRVVAADIELALPAAPDGTPAVAIELGAGGANGTHVDGPGVGRAWLARDGNAARVRIDARAGAPPAALVGFVQGIALPAALQLLGDRHLHAAAVVVDGAVVALIGEPGAGKSVLAAALARRGCRFYGDDGLVIAGGAAPRAVLGSPHLRLRDDAAAALAIDLAGAAVCPSSGKWIVAPDGVAGIEVDRRALPVRAVYAIARGAGAPRATEVRPARAAVELLAAEFHPTPERRPVDDERARFEAAVALARAVPMRAIEFPDDLDCLADAAAAILDDLGG